MPATGSLSGLLAYPGSYDPGMPACSTIHTIDGEHSLTFYCENLPTDEAAEAAGRNPNGYFWEVSPPLPSRTSRNAWNSTQKPACSLLSEQSRISSTSKKAWSLY